MLNVLSSLFVSFGKCVSFEFFSVLLIFPCILALFSGLVGILTNR